MQLVIVFACSMREEIQLWRKQSALLSSKNQKERFIYINTYMCSIGKCILRTEQPFLIIQALNIYFYLFIQLPWVSVGSMRPSGAAWQVQFPTQDSRPGLPVWRVWSLGHWIHQREPPTVVLYKSLHKIIKGQSSDWLDQHRCGIQGYLLTFGCGEEEGSNSKGDRNWPSHDCHRKAESSTS